MERKIIPIPIKGTILKSCFLLLLVLFSVSMNAQITVAVRNQSLKEILKVIEIKSEYRFFYSEGLKELDKITSLEVSNATIDQTMSKLLLNSKVSYKLEKKNLIVLVAEMNPKESVLKKITGQVTNQNGEPIIGATIIEKETKKGTITDINGNYIFNGLTQNSILQFSYIGMQTFEVKAGNQSVVNVLLKDASINLNEVVAIGYGSTKKSDLTGAATNIGAKDFNKGMTLSPGQMIQGKVVGMQIINNSGAPGAEMTVRIRGTNSVRSGNQPLFVVDGIPLNGTNTQPGANASGLGTTPGADPLSFINSNDIETIDVLKDASATAIYGSRGANGVVIITTKKGKAGIPSIDFSESVGMSNLMTSPNFMSATQYRQMISNRSLKGIDGGASTNALDEITRTAIIQNYNVAISGGNDKGTYRISLGYADQQGIIKSSDFKKYVGNFTGRYAFLKKDRLHIDVNLIASNTINTGVPISNNANVYGSLIGNALEWNPTVPLKNATGSLVQKSYNEGTVNVAGVGTNPLALIEYYKDVSNVSNILANVSPSFRILDGLEYKFTLGLNQSKGNRTTDISGNLFLSGVTNQGFANVGSMFLNTTTINHVLSYKKKIGANLNLDAIVGYEYLNYNKKSSNISASGFNNFDILGSQILQNPLKGNVGVTSSADPTNSLQSYFSRINLNFYNRYLLTGTMRADGSTKFGVNNKYGYFPSLAGAWIFSEEKFCPIFFSNLKLRASYGVTGNQEFPAGSAQSRYVFGQQSLSLANVANPDLKWESTVSYDFGFDFGFFHNRLTGTVDYYNKTTKDLLFQLPALQPAPNANFWTNLPAKILNKGLEVSLKGVLIDKTNLYWDMSINMSFQSNKFTNYSGAPILTGNVNGSGLADGVPAQQLANNYPLFAFNMLEYKGVDVNGAAQYSTDKKYVGSPSPSTLLGIYSNLTIRKLTLNMGFNGAFGQKIYNNTNMVNLAPTNINIGRNSTPEIGLSNENLNNTNVVSTRYLENGDYLRLSNVGLSYNFGSFHDFKNINVFITGQNLLIFTKYKGMDPEVNTNKSVNGVPSLGIDYGSYPTGRTFMIGFNTKF